MPDLNGHFSTYWQTGFYDYDAQVDIGRYLAGDKGGTLTLSRNFPSGWSVGGFFTLTDAASQPLVKEVLIRVFFSTFL